MNINHICLNNKFGAKVVGELKKEISNKKKETLQNFRSS